MKSQVIKNFYDKMNFIKHKISATFVFVYNDYSTYSDDDPHLEECYDDEEKNEIIDAVFDLFEEIICYGSETAFIKNCELLKATNRPVYVYTMAQQINGYNRRVLIPALCLHYGFINLNADPYMSAIGCNKETMYNLLKLKSFNKFIPPTLYFDLNTPINLNVIKNNCGECLVIKPICESCCIDVFVIQEFVSESVMQTINYLINKYNRCMVQKYIPGREIGVTVVYHDSDYYALPPIEIIFQDKKQFLSHEDSYYDNYDLGVCDISEILLRECEKMSKALEYNCITRYDFRFDGYNYFLFDISPNPTLSGHSSSNYAARNLLNCDHRGIYKLLAFEKLYLFEPSFYCTI